MSITSEDRPYQPTPEYPTRETPPEPVQEPPILLKISTKNWRDRQSRSASTDSQPAPIHSPSSSLLKTTIMTNRSISTTISVDPSDRRPTRNRRPPTTYTTYKNPEPTLRRRSRQDSHDHHVQIDSMGRTRSAKSVLGTIDHPHSTTAQHEDSNPHLNQPPPSSHQLLVSEDKDADGEDDDGGDEEDYPSIEAGSDSDYHAGTGEPSDKPAPSEDEVQVKRTTRRPTRAAIESDESNFNPRAPARRPTRRKQIDSNESQEEQAEDEEEEEEEIPSDNGEYNAHSTSSKRARAQRLRSLARDRAVANQKNIGIRRSARNAAVRYGNINGDDSDQNRRNKHAQEEEEGRQLRNRKHVDYHIPGLDAVDAEDKNKLEGDRARDKRLPMNMSGKQLDRLFGSGHLPGPDSDDEPTPTFGQVNGPGRLGGASNGIFGTSLLDPGSFAAGGPSNMGKMSGTTNLADTDPLGIQTNIDFSHVGGMENHIQQLKEMVSLPLLYPEVFQRFQVTPPRGVLFHGPPGTGKTLLARALAASCSSEGQKISFFMRKGADCLSKWVGEAERQLRLLFEEAKNCQPSIIFFDEIDGLAPVRSSKQEQIHASIVSTLLSLMDGMDGRGQVVIIGATNRPDAIDPALRRPGRFDREFYFPLPNREARLSILNIHTRGWNPPLSEDFKLQLADLTKGYGGADLRALCTDAALNAVQRKYPQIYKTADRLLIDPQSIDVVPRDFTLAQRHLIPSTSRSTANIASPLPPHLEPLLAESFKQLTDVLDKMLPDVKKPNVLEEAEYEDVGGGFEKEKMMQTFQTLRVFRPRLVVCGPKGSGQQYIGPAILNHLEGYHVQSLDLANFLGDSTISADARCVQIFTEAKRHKPSVLYIPSLHHWQTSPVLAGVVNTVTSLLDELKASDPILLLAVVDCPFKKLSKEIQSWFGVNKSNRHFLSCPNDEQRVQFFADTIANIQRPPTEFPDGLPRKKRVLEVLPKAPPREPRKPTQVELQSHLAHDQKLVEYLKFRLGPVLNELKKKHKRFTKPIRVPGTSVPQEANGDVTAAPKYYDVDLESMHYKLYYNRYLTSQQFVADVEKIVFNAEQDCQQSATRDYDLVVKAQAMLTHTRVMVEQACDQQFDIDCHRMYERMKIRDASLAHQGKKKGGKTADENERGVKRMIDSLEDQHTSDERPSKRNKGHQLGPSDGSDQEGEEAADGQIEGDQTVREEPASQAPELLVSTTPDYESGQAPADASSRPTTTSISRLNILNNDQQVNGHHYHPSENNSNNNNSPLEFSIPLVYTTTPFQNADWPASSLVDKNQETESSWIDSNLHPVSQNQKTNTSHNSEVNHEKSLTTITTMPTLSTTTTTKDTTTIITITTMEEEPRLPKFEVKSKEINKLKDEIKERTRGLSVDLLEEIRAGLTNVIWKHKAEFDRSQMIDSCLLFLVQFSDDLTHLSLTESSRTTSRLLPHPDHSDRLDAVDDQDCDGWGDEYD